MVSITAGLLVFADLQYVVSPGLTLSSPIHSGRHRAPLIILVQGKLVSLLYYTVQQCFHLKPTPQHFSASFSLVIRNKVILKLFMPILCKDVGVKTASDRNLLLLCQHSNTYKYILSYKYNILLYSMLIIRGKTFEKQLENKLRTTSQRKTLFDWHLNLNQKFSEDRNPV